MDIKADMNVSLLARADKVVSIKKFDSREDGRIVNIRLSDDTGALVVPILVGEDDTGWLENAARLHLYIYLHIDIKADEKGGLYAGQTMDISIVDEKQVKLFKKAERKCEM